MGNPPPPTLLHRSVFQISWLFFFSLQRWGGKEEKEKVSSFCFTYLVANEEGKKTDLPAGSSKI